MQQFFMAIILVLGLSSFYLYNQNTVLKNNNVNKLAIAKPGMIEKRANDQTLAVFESIENDSKELDSLDDPSSDINPDN